MSSILAPLFNFDLSEFEEKIISLAYLFEREVPHGAFEPEAEMRILKGISALQNIPFSWAKEITHQVLEDEKWS